MSEKSTAVRRTPEAEAPAALAFDWLAALPWACLRCGAAIHTKELAPRCPRCGHHEAGD